MVNAHYEKYKETIKRVARRNYRKRIILLNEVLADRSCIHCGESETVCLKFYPHDAEIRKITKRVGTNNIKAVLSGKNKKELEFIYFQENQIINEDETVHTSGDGGYFNSGIPVGMTKIQDDKIYVIPTNNLEELQYLQIFLNNFKSF